MSNSDPIGVFDSGIGGLSVLSKIRTQLPAENLVYIADAAYVPYGNKSEHEIQLRAELISQYLIEQYRVKAIVIACNTATAAAVTHLRECLSIPIIGMEPGVKPAVEQSRSGVVGILATENTLKSEKFSHLMNRFGEQAEVISQHCSGLVERIEQGDLSGSATRELVQRYLSPLLDKGVDSIVLGCTHYPFIKPLIEELVGPTVQVIETGDAVARHLKNRLEQHQLINASTQAGSMVFFTTDGNTDINNYARFWNEPVDFSYLALCKN
ncbi:MAG: glutamate racemase [Gammaproteobacteria bacterium]|nr:glutamate racemase [Gammaproteobacteria bacterium]